MDTDLGILHMEKNGKAPVTAGSTIVLRANPCVERNVAAAGFLADGVQREEKVVAVLSSSAPNFLDRMDGLGVDSQDAIDRGMLIIIDWDRFRRETIRGIEDKDGIIAVSVDLANVTMALGSVMDGVDRVLIDIYDSARTLYSQEELNEHIPSLLSRARGKTTLFVISDDSSCENLLSFSANNIDGILSLSKAENGSRVSLESMDTNVKNVSGRRVYIGDEGLVMERSGLRCAICDSRMDEDEEDCRVCGADAHINRPEKVLQKMESQKPGLFLCSSCGAFIAEDADRCDVCGTEFIVEDDEGLLVGGELEEPPYSHRDEGVLAYLVHRFFNVFEGRSKYSGEMISGDESLTSSGFTNGLSTGQVDIMEDGLTNGAGRGFTNGSGRGFTNGSGRTNGFTNGMTNGLSAASGEGGAGVAERRSFESDSEILGQDHRTRFSLSKRGDIAWFASPDGYRGDAYFRRGLFSDRRGNLDEALENYERAADMDSRDIRAYDNIASILRKKGMFEKSIYFSKRSIEVYPEDIVAWLNLGNALWGMGRYEEALKCHQFALQLDEEAAPCWNNRGMDHLALGRLPLALEDVVRATDMDERYLLAWLNRGNILAEASRYDEALKCYDWVISLDLTYESAWFNKALTLFELKRYGEALKAVERLLFYNPDDLEALNLKALLIYSIVKYQDVNSYSYSMDQALSIFQHISVSEPENPIAMNNVGMVLLEMGHYDMALEELERAVRLGGENPIFLFNMSLSYAGSGDYTAAKNTIERALTRMPDLVHKAAGSKHLSGLQGDADFERILSRFSSMSRNIWMDKETRKVPLKAKRRIEQ